MSEEPRESCALIVESASEGHDALIRSRCACGWTPRWEHWAFNGSVQPSFMLTLVLYWRRHTALPAGRKREEAP